MDIYKENFEKGAVHFIDLLYEINWFDNPYLDKDEIVNQIKACTFPPYYGTYLRQLGFSSEYGGEEQLIDILNILIEFIPNSSYEINAYGVKLYIGNNDYDIVLNVAEFAVGEGEDGFLETTINEILDSENLVYRFYELPPDDDNCSFVFVKPEVYKKALEKGVIPDFFGYYAVNY